jgi:tetratricopeptide (TPR) repeat protein
MRRQLVLAAFIIGVVTSPPALADDRTTCFSVDNDSYTKKENLKQGEDACSRLIDAGAWRKPLASLHRARGAWRQKNGDLDAALTDYATAIKIEPKNAEGYDYRADVYRQRGDLERALSDYDRASKLDPLYAAAHYSRGRIFEKQNHLEKAREEYSATLKVQVRDRIAQWAHDNARARLKELDDEKDGAKK